jgi:hypothetical protein
MELMIVAKWNPEFGKDENSPRNIEKRYFILYTIELMDFLYEFKDVLCLVDFFKKNYKGDKTNIKIIVGRPYTYPSGEMIVLKESKALNIIQNKWKQYLNKKKSPKHLRTREIYGKWKF